MTIGYWGISEMERTFIEKKIKKTKRETLEWKKITNNKSLPPVIFVSSRIQNKPEVQKTISQAHSSCIVIVGYFNREMPVLNLPHIHFWKVNCLEDFSLPF